VPFRPGVGVTVTVAVRVGVGVAEARTVGNAAAAAVAVRADAPGGVAVGVAVVAVRAAERPLSPGSRANTTAENTASNATRPPSTARMRTCVSVTFHSHDEAHSIVLSAAFWVLKP
jgi:hypothetical protein